MATSTSVSYKYILTNLLTNKVIAEVPFVDVTWGRALKSAGSFSGDIAVTDETAYLNLYETTMPAKTAIYVMRNDVCVWGGIIWSRNYKAKERKLTVSGLEFTSYFAHRKIWKDFSNSFEATLVVSSEVGAFATVTLSRDNFGFEAGGDVKIVFKDANYYALNGTFKVQSNPSTDVFEIDPAERVYTINKVSLKKGVATFTTKTPHGFSVGEELTVSGISLSTKTYPNAQNRMNQTQIVTKVPALNQFTAKIDVDQALKIDGVKQNAKATANGSLPEGTYTVTVIVSIDTYEYVRRLIDGMASDFSGTSYPNSNIEPGVSYAVDITGYGREANVGTITTEQPHELSVGQYFNLESLSSDVNGKHAVLEVIDENTVTFYSEGEAIPFASVYSKTVYLTKRQRRSKIATYTTSTEHSFSAGDYVTISNVTSTKVVNVQSEKAVQTELAELAAKAEKNNKTPTKAEIDKIKAKVKYDTYNYNGTFLVIDTPSTTKFGVAYQSQTQDDKKIQSIVPSGVATSTPVMTVGSYGPFSKNADIGITFEEYYSNVPNASTSIRGDEMQSLEKVLSTFADDIDGFDYRIDCDYDVDTGSFLRVFKFIPRNFPNPPLNGEVSPISRFGAQNVVFEFPGNVSSVEMSENAENAATRFFAIGDKAGSGDAAYAYHSGAAAEDLLADDWLLLDEDEKVSGETNEEVLYQWAERYLFESRPPMGEISISVNGSIDPVVGSYYPGDWCCVIIDDDFIRQRLASNMEPREDLILRKILGYSVKVKDSLGVPEEVSITLVPDWEVDTYAQ